MTDRAPVEITNLDRYGSAALPFRRAARWEGIIPTGRTGTPSPNDIRDMRAYIDSYRTATTPFEIVFQGRPMKSQRKNGARMWQTMPLLE
jgi:hypothetical protein